MNKDKLEDDEDYCDADNCDGIMKDNGTAYVCNKCDNWRYSSS